MPINLKKKFTMKNPKEELRVKPRHPIKPSKRHKDHTKYSRKRKHKGAE